MPLLELAILIVSIMVLAKSSQAVVNSTVKLSAFFGISNVAIGFVLLSTATSLPELSVSVISSAVENGAISAGNVFGSNVADILLVLGAGAFLYKIKLKKKEISDIALILLSTSLITLLVVYFVGLDKIEGLFLLAIFLAYLLYLSKRKVSSNHSNGVGKAEALTAFITFCIGIVLVLVSSGFVVDAAVRLAELAGLSKAFIGATIIAVGTSLPEISLSLQAIRVKRYELALGNAIGSTMVNITLVLGVAALINPIQVNLKVLMPVIFFALLANLLLFYFISTRKILGRNEGLIFIGTYLIFLVMLAVAQIYAY